MDEILKVKDYLTPINGLFSHIDYDFEFIEKPVLDLLVFTTFGERRVAPVVSSVLSLKPTEEELRRRALLSERADLESWLKKHDYIGTKIATGRATVEEYASEIAEMTEKANRINEIDNELNSIPKDTIVKVAGCVVALFIIIAWLIYML